MLINLAVLHIPPPFLDLSQNFSLRFNEPYLQRQVVLDGQASDPVPVLSSVPKGSVLGLILFLIFMNDLPDKIKSSVCLFADDCVLYRNIHSLQDCLILQEDLYSLGL